MGYLIYAHINNLNNKYYIGQTILEAQKRWRNGGGYKNQPKFYRAIKKYGWENFTHIILEADIPTIEQANEREKYWISFYNSIKNGYNVSIGGTIPQYFCKPVYQLDYNKNIINCFESTREAERQTGISQANISHCCTGRTNSANGYWWCYVVDYNTYICKPAGASNGRPRYIAKYDLNNTLIEVFSSLSNAERATSIPHQNISKCCNNKLKSAGGFIWRFIDEETKSEN